MARLVASQYGVFSREQALRAGIGKSTISRRIASRRWDVVHSGVFRIAGAPWSWHQALVAACLAWGDGAVVSHRAAAALWRLPGFEPGPVEVTVPRTRRRRVDGVIAHWIPNQSAADATSIGPIPVTTAARTLIDLATVASLNTVEEALDDAVRRRLVSLARLERALTGAPRRSGVAKVRSILVARDPTAAVPESVFETMLLRLLKASGLPAPVMQYKIRTAGKAIAIVDFAFPAERLAVEADGYRWHSGRVRWERDLQRRNALTALGWRVLHVTWGDLVKSPDDVIRGITRAISHPTT